MLYTDGAFRNHSRSIYNYQVGNTFRATEPISAGLGAMVAPAALSAAIFSAAVPELPVIIAPACPILRPGGALLPATKATTGLVISLI
jgi:hypothetical protein